MPIRLDQLVAERFGLSRRAAARRSATAGSTWPAIVAMSRAWPSSPMRRSRSSPIGRRRRKVAQRLQVLFEDRHLIIVDKTAGLLSVPTPDRECNTLRERTGRYLQLRYGGRPYLGVVHRLDKDTSGALVFARSPEALRLCKRCSRPTPSSASIWRWSRARPSSTPAGSTYPSSPTATAAVTASPTMTKAATR